jgi:hypothetical protein
MMTPIKGIIGVGEAFKMFENKGINLTLQKLSFIAFHGVVLGAALYKFSGK